jgi:hypothetical protein
LLGEICTVEQTAVLDYEHGENSRTVKAKENTTPGTPTPQQARNPPQKLVIPD